MTHALETAQYEHSDEEALNVGWAALKYIIDGEVDDLPLGFRGAAIFGVIAVLREHDKALYSEPSALSAEQRVRLEEIEADINNAVDAKLQYYPFGHDRKINRELNVDIQKPYSSWLVNLYLSRKKR